MADDVRCDFLGNQGESEDFCYSPAVIRVTATWTNKYGEAKEGSQPPVHFWRCREHVPSRSPHLFNTTVDSDGDHWVFAEEYTGAGVWVAP
jgi:hypothetical protein